MTPARIVAAATFFNVLVSIGLWHVTCRYQQVTTRIFQASQTPYVFPKLTPPVLDPQRNEVVTPITLRNTGNGAALRLTTTWRSLIKRPEPFWLRRPLARVLPGMTMLAPQEEQNMRVGLVSGTALSRIAVGIDLAQVTIKVRYESVTKHRYRAWKQYEYNHTANIWEVIKSGYVDHGCAGRSGCEEYLGCGIPIPAGKGCAR